MSSHTRIPKGQLLAIGGHERRTGPGQKNSANPEENDTAGEFILERFVQELPNKNTVLVIPTASKQPEEAVEDYVKVFKSLGVEKIEVLDIKSREEANGPEVQEILNKADGVMFTGGDQLRLTAILGGTRFLKRLYERYIEEPIVIAGTSAGAAAMSTPMIYQGRNDAGFLKDEIHITTGLQLMRDVAIDTHFVARGRIIRMAQIIATNPGCIGLGLEEDTGVLVSKGLELEVLGNGLVVVVDGHDCSGNTIYQVQPGEVFSIRDLRVHLLSKGERYTLPL